MLHSTHSCVVAIHTIFKLHVVSTRINMNKLLAVFAVVLTAQWVSAADPTDAPTAGQADSYYYPSYLTFTQNDR
jgi:hypothetical protein